MALIQALRDWLRRIWHYARSLTPEQLTAASLAVTAAATSVLALSVFVAYLEYRHKDDTERLQRALSLIEKANVEPVASARCCSLAWPGAEERAEWKWIEERRALLLYFPKRFEGLSPVPLSDKDADKLVAVSLERDLDTPESKTLYKSGIPLEDTSTNLKFSHLPTFTTMPTKSCSRLLCAGAWHEAAPISNT
jgi:hypothetical protein